MEKNGPTNLNLTKMPKIYETAESIESENLKRREVCASVAEYCKSTRPSFVQSSLFENVGNKTDKSDVRVVELFAGVGGFRIGLERASERFKTVWNNQWEPSTKRQDASLIYSARFGVEGHSNKDIATVPTSEIPPHDLLVGGFPCQDYSVATTLKRSGGIEGKKGVLWWQIYRIINESTEKPKYLFFENVDRLLKSPAKQRGRDFAIILASLSDLGYNVEWRVINAAEYGMPQRRRRTYILAYRRDLPLAKRMDDCSAWILDNGIFAQTFPVNIKEGARLETFRIEGALDEISANFNNPKEIYSFGNSGCMVDRLVTTIDTVPDYNGVQLTLGQILIPEDEVPSDFFISPENLERWKYMKGSKSEMRKSPEGYEYRYSEGAMAFPDYLDRPSRTIITGEGGAGPSRFKHVVLTPSGRYRRLTPLELERLNMFPDNHTFGATDSRRAFLMGNALVTGIVEKVGFYLLREIDS